MERSGERERLEAVNDGLNRAVCGPSIKPDRVYDAPRILRLPETYNWKYEAPRMVRVVRWRPELRYSVEQLEAVLRERFAWVGERAAPPAAGARSVRPAVNLTRPGDDFNARGEWAEVLVPHGWRLDHRCGEVEHWCRPEKRRGTSATVNYAGSGLLYVFSSDAPPFQADESYSKFAAYCLLSHGGDWRAATRELAARGYGRPANGGLRFVVGTNQQHKIAEAAEVTGVRVRILARRAASVSETRPSTNVRDTRRKMRNSRYAAGSSPRDKRRLMSSRMMP
ncbi:MAG: hypothetical protein HY332_25575 [Chloroflexi bacterium]|nr:hypothetical protein [Chloroflexota bacterium]